MKEESNVEVFKEENTNLILQEKADILANRDLESNNSSPIILPLETEQQKLYQMKENAKTDASKEQAPIQQSITSYEETKNNRQVIGKNVVDFSDGKIVFWGDRITEGVGIEQFRIENTVYSTILYRRCFRWLDMHRQ